MVDLQATSAEPKATDSIATSYLNTENIARSNAGIEYHPLRPFLPENARVLFLGSFPPQRKRWCMDFYYPNFINDHWRIETLWRKAEKHLTSRPSHRSARSRA